MAFGAERTIWALPEKKWFRQEWFPFRKKKAPVASFQILHKLPFHSCMQVDLSNHVVLYHTTLRFLISLLFHFAFWYIFFPFPRSTAFFLLSLTRLLTVSFAFSIICNELSFFYLLITKLYSTPFGFCSMQIVQSFKVLNVYHTFPSSMHDLAPSIFIFLSFFFLIYSTMSSVICWYRKLSSTMRLRLFFLKCIEQRKSKWWASIDQTNTHCQQL